MNGAATYLVGEHDFGAFGHPTVGEVTIRVVHRAAWQAEVAAGEPGREGHLEGLWRFVIEANGFLRGMVRRIVGTLLLVGGGSMPPAGFAEILSSGDIRRAAPPAPACGLCMWCVRYGGQDGREARDE